MASGLPSPTLTNPDMILPWEQASSTDTSPSTARLPHQLPSPPLNEPRFSRSDRPENARRQKGNSPSLSPFRNGVLSRPGAPTRARSISERGDGRIKFENSRLSYKPSGDVIVNSPSSRREDSSNSKRRIIIQEEDDEEEEVPDNTYSTPAILEEDEDNPNSHTAMSKRAEEILANAKMRLTNMEGNLNRARSTLGTRPSSSMSSFNNQNGNSVALYGLPSDRVDRAGFSPLKHRQGTAHAPETSGHSRVFSETSVPSSLNTKPIPGPEGLGITDADGESPNHEQEPSRRWFWNGLNRSTSIGNKYNKSLEPLDENGPAADENSRVPTPEKSSRSSEENARIRRIRELERAASTFDVENPPATGLTRARSTAQMRDIRDQVQDLKGKISTLKRRARQDSLYRRSLQNLRTPSPFTAADTSENWYRGVPLAAERQASIERDLKEDGEMQNAEPSGQTDGDIRDAPNSPAEAEEAGKDNDSGVDLQEQDRDNEEPVSNVKLPRENAGEAANALIDPQLQRVAPEETKSKNPWENLGEARVVETEGDRHITSSDSLEERAAIDEISDGPDDFQDSGMVSSGERHEDRPDAFDYEHFFLYSGSGHYSRRSKSHESSSSSSENGSQDESETSEFSVETTKPDDAAKGLRSKAGLPETDYVNSHARKESVESASTADTFATATEGRETDEETQESTPRNTIVVPPRSDSLKKKPPKLDRRGNTRKSKQEKRAQPSPGTRAPSNSLSSAAGFVPVSSAASGMASLPAIPSMLTFLASFNPGKEAEQTLPSKPIRLGDGDREMAERVINSLAKVCIRLESEGSNGSKYDARMCRRKLESARRVLDGETNGEAF